MPGTTSAPLTMRDQWRQPPGWREEGEKWLEACLLLTHHHHQPPPPLPHASKSAFFLALAWSFSCLLLCARTMYSHAVDLFMECFRIKKCFFGSDGPDLSKPALHQRCHSQGWPRPCVASFYIHIQAEQKQIESICPGQQSYSLRERNLKVVNTIEYFYA